MITTGRAEWAERLKMLALHGMSHDAWKRYSDEGFKHYAVELAGFKYNMTDIQASLGLHQLKRVEKNLRRRVEIWNRYDAAFRGLPLVTPAPPEPGTLHARHLYTVLVDGQTAGLGRDEFAGRLRQMNIGTGVHYIAAHLQPYYQRTWNYQRGDFPEAEYISDRTLSLPLGPKMSDQDVEDVIAAVRHVVQQASSQRRK